MTTQAQFQTLFTYQATMYEKLLDCAANLADEEYRQRQPHRMGSLHDILFHILYWHNLWRVGIEGDQNNPGLQAADFPTLARLRSAIQQERGEWQRLLATLAADDLEAERMALGVTAPLWRMLQHLILHSMQHHSEAAAILTAKGYSPNSIDFIWYTG